MSRSLEQLASGGVAALDHLHEFQFVLGFLVIIVALVYLAATHSERHGVSIIVAAMQLTDLLFGLASCANGVRGLFISSYDSLGNKVRPVKCALTAPHNHLWWVADGANAILLMLAAVDQLLSVLRSKTHAKTSQCYFRYSVIALIFLLPALTLAPALCQAIDNAKNATVVIEPYCFFSNVYDWRVFWPQYQMRYWAPVLGLLILAVTALIILILQLKQKWQFKWSDDNDESTKLYFLIITRCVIFGACVTFPARFFNRNDVLPPLAAREISSRLVQAVLILVVSTPVHVLLLSRFRRRVASFFHLVDLQRTWQSAHDPPNAFDKSAADSISWTSMTGNIVSEAGVPNNEMNADEQRSISFFYERNPNL